MSGIGIEGGCCLTGEMEIQGSKNAVLPVLAASILHSGVTVFTHVPDIADVRASLEILELLGARTEFREHFVRIDATGIIPREIPKALGEKMRSSVLFLGPLLARFREGILYRPGGCAIGKRPVDYHLAGLSRIGAELEEESGRIRASANHLAGGTVMLPYPSVGATEQLLLAACGADGPTQILGAAREPEIVTLCRYLKMAGAEITGEGSSEIVIRGFQPVRREIRFRIPGDRIAAGSYLAAAAVTKGRLYIKGIHPNHLWASICGFRSMGCELRLEPEGILLSAPERLTALPFLSTDPYPAFPTDMQSAFLSMMAVAAGTSVMKENVFEKRLAMAAELNRMGADIRVDGNQAFCTGVERLHGTTVYGTDLRSGAGLIAAALAADGITTVEGFEYVERGYENMIELLQTLGARVWRITE
ncbi:UDP-N-acetylglucosamine 1-carboxyvinyltransferase [Hominifimenecus sp. rT4P-3]|uniref:UDP-N-acetylglucosamine 1-carboxyvinyltransferase n=1 Tax=Hominifimenecus sp. rT4P-3 TaxID=3242979 RepID=UPI003DA59E76